MKTKVITLIFTLFLITSRIASGQDAPAPINAAKSFIGVAGGIAMPTGNFAASDFTNTETQHFPSDAHDNSLGFAQNGVHLALEGAYYITPYFGIGGVFNTSSFSVNVSQIALAYIKAFDCDSGTCTARNYNSVSLLVGPYFAFPVQKLTIEARILGGVTNTTSPDIIVEAINRPDPTDPISISKFVQTSGTAATFGFQAGLGIKYAVMEHWSIGIRGDYFYSKPNIAVDNVGRQDNTGREIFSYNQPIAGFAGTVGIAYLFGK